MAASLHAFVLLRNPNPSLYGVRSSAVRAPCAASFPLGAAPRGLGPAHSLLSRRCAAARFVPAEQRLMKVIPRASSPEEPSHIEIDESEEDMRTEASQDAFKEALEDFKVKAMKTKGVAQEAYEVYSKKAKEILMEASEKLRIEADKAQADFSIIANEISEEGKEYLITAANKSPDSVREVLEVYASSDDWKNISSARDFYYGIPYGCFLSIGGFLYFMLTGSIPAIRFGVVLGTAILALSVASLRSWKKGKASSLLLTGQTAISAIIFFQQFSLCCQKGLFPNIFILLISGAMLGFYIYRIIVENRNKSPGVEQSK